MKTLTNTILALGAVAVLGTTGIYAQTRSVANVPFQFTVATVSMPAGEYSLKALSSTSGVIQITNLGTGRSTLVMAPSTLSTYQGKSTEAGKVIFNRYGDRYFFSEVWSPGGLRGCAKPTKLEQELRASTSETQMASIDITLSGAK